MRYLLIIFSFIFIYNFNIYLNRCNNLNNEVYALYINDFYSYLMVDNEKKIVINKEKFISDFNLKGYVVAFEENEYFTFLIKDKSFPHIERKFELYLVNNNEDK